MLQKRPKDQWRRGGKWSENTRTVTLKNGNEVEIEEEEQVKKRKTEEKEEKQGAWGSNEKKEKWHKNKQQEACFFLQAKVAGRRCLRRFCFLFFFLNLVLDAFYKTMF